MKEKVDVVITLPDNTDRTTIYPYKNLPLMRSIGKDILFLLFEGKGPFKRQDAIEAVSTYHLNNGGAPPRGDLTVLIKGHLLV